MKQELQFLVMANCELELEDFIQKLKLKLGKTQHFSLKSFNYENNWVQIRINEDFDEQLSKTDKDAFLYYKYRIEVSPIEEVTLNEQIKIARQFIKVIEDLGGDVEICSTFEDKL